MTKMNDPRWTQVLSDAQKLINKIDAHSNEPEDKFRESAQNMNDLLKTIRYDKKIDNEEEEELMTIVEKLTELRQM